MDEMFPALQWQQFISERMVQRFLMFPAWFNSRLQCARAAQVPVANLRADERMTMSDLCYARMLKHNRHILWASEAAVPDLGGAEGDQHDVWSDKMVEPIINEPSCYRTISIELDIQCLAIQAIDQASSLDASELTTVSTYDGNTNTNTDISSGGTAVSHEWSI